MKTPCIYQLADMERRLDFPYRLSQIGWMPRHVFYHRNTVIREVFFCFSFNKAGQAVTEINGVVAVGGRDASFSMLTPGTVLNTERGELHDELFFVYPAETLGEFQKMFGMEKFSLSGVHADRELREDISRIRRSLNHLHEGYAPDMLDSLAFAFISRMFLLNCRNQSSPGREDIRMEAISAELTEGKPLSEIIRRYGFSRRSFFRAWQQFCPDRSPVQYRLDYQLARAETLLLQSDLPVGRIVRLCGFSSNVHFCRIFRQRHGCSATEFRCSRGGRMLPEFGEEKD